jgi:GTP cyclohydrolase IA
MGQPSLTSRTPDIGPAPGEREAEVLPWRPRMTPDTAAVDLQAAEAAAAALLVALGQDLDSVHVADTPRRMAAAYAELLTVEPFDFTTFPNSEGYDELVLVEDIPVRSVCEHHMLPFVGVAHVGYLPADRVLGLSKLARVVDFYSHRPQTQERLTQQVAEHLQTHLCPRGAGVVIEAEHTCMTLRGVRATGTRTVTSALLGRLRTDAASRAEFLGLTRDRRTR